MQAIVVVLDMAKFDAVTLAADGLICSLEAYYAGNNSCVVMLDFCERGTHDSEIVVVRRRSTEVTDVNAVITLKIRLQLSVPNCFGPSLLNAIEEIGNDARTNPRCKCINSFGKILVRCNRPVAKAEGGAKTARVGEPRIQNSLRLKIQIKTVDNQIRVVTIENKIIDVKQDGNPARPRSRKHTIYVGIVANP